MKIFFLKILMWLQIGLSRLVDMVMQLFTVFSGIEDVRAGNQDVSLLLYFLGNDTVTKVFWSLLVLGIFCLCVFTVIAIIKNMVVVKKTVAQIVGKMFMSMLSMIVVVICLFVFVFGANCVLVEVNVAFNQGDELTLGQQLFEASVPDDAWESGYFDDLNGSEEGMKAIFGTDDDGNIKKSWDGVKPDKIFGKYQTGMFGIEDEENGPDKDYPSIVNIDEYDFFIGLPASVIIAVVMFIAIMGLVTRLYDLVFVFLTSPLIMSTIPLDDGAKFKLWRETAISKTLLAYGTVFAVNIYVILLPHISKLRIPGNSMLTTLMQVLLIICGALTISNGQIFFARLLGTDAQESRQAAHGFRTMFAGVMGTARLVKGAARMTFGQYNAYTGHRERGLMQRAGKLGGAVGTMLTGGFKDREGNAVGFGKGVANKMGDLRYKLRTKWHDDKGLAGQSVKLARAGASAVRGMHNLRKIKRDGFDMDI